MKKSSKEVEKKKETEENFVEWATKCKECKRTCKQFAYHTVVKCPLFKRKD